MKANLFLVISSKMDNNKKKGRNEDELIRLSKKVRESLGLQSESTVELWPDSDSAKVRINRSRLLGIHGAFLEDINKLKDAGTPEEDLMRAGFVTTKTFNYICRNEDVRLKKANSIWLSNSVEDTVIGGDPEFLLTTGEKTFKYAAEIDGLGHNDELGEDGPAVEIRPQPSIKVEEFVSNIANILNNHPNAKKISRYGWVGGCYFKGRKSGGEERHWTLGGHIHLGTPLKIYNAAKASRQEALNNVFTCLKKVIDELVAVPIMKVEGMDLSIKRRTNSQYGGITDIRTEHQRLEYRTISGEWLLHPDLALAVLGTVKAIAHAYFMALTDAKMASEIMDHKRDWFREDISWSNMAVMKMLGTTKSWQELKYALHEGKIRIDNNYVSRVRKTLRALPTYKDYHKYIDKFLAIIRLPENVLRSQTRDLKEGWINGSPYLIR